MKRKEEDGSGHAMRGGAWAEGVIPGTGTREGIAGRRGARRGETPGGVDEEPAPRSSGRLLAEKARMDLQERRRATGRRAGRRVWMPVFLAVLSQSGNVRLACYAADITRQNVYNARARDAAFREAWETAMETAVDLLEEEAWRRAYDGVSRPLISHGRPVLDESGRPMVERYYSDMLLDRLLRAHRPQKYREQSAAGEPNTVVKVYSGFDPDDV